MMAACVKLHGFRRPYAWRLEGVIGNEFVYGGHVFRILEDVG